MRVLELRPDEPRARKLRLLLDAAIGVAGERPLARAVSRLAILRMMTDLMWRKSRLTGIRVIILAVCVPAGTASP